MGIEKVTENPIISGSDGGRGTANLVYILYIVGFFFPLTALVGAVLAYVNRDKATKIFASHMGFQVHIFIRGLIFTVINLILYLITLFASFATLGFGVILMLIPLAVLLWWAIWTIIKIAKGMGALGRGEPAPI